MALSRTAPYPAGCGADKQDAPCSPLPTCGGGVRAKRAGGGPRVRDDDLSPHPDPLPRGERASMWSVPPATLPSWAVCFIIRRSNERRGTRRGRAMSQAQFEEILGSIAKAIADK